MAVYAAFCAYATAAAAVSGGRDRLWAIWAACGYAAALAVLWLWRGRRGLIAMEGEIQEHRQVHPGDHADVGLDAQAGGHPGPRARVTLHTE